MSVGWGKVVKDPEGRVGKDLSSLDHKKIFDGVADLDDNLPLNHFNLVPHLHHLCHSTFWEQLRTRENIVGRGI